MHTPFCYSLDFLRIWTIFLLPSLSPHKTLRENKPGLQSCDSRLVSRKQELLFKKSSESYSSHQQQAVNKKLSCEELLAQLDALHGIPKAASLMFRIRWRDSSHKGTFPSGFSSLSKLIGTERMFFSKPNRSQSWDTTFSVQAWHMIFTLTYIC